MLRAGGYGLLPIHDVAKDVIATFDCGRANLNSFLSDASHKMHEHRLGFTSVVFHEDVKGPLGYFTLSNDAIPLNSSEIFEFGIEDGHGLSAFPAVKIGRLAVSSAYHGRGVGGAVMNLILGECTPADSRCGQSPGGGQLLRETQVRDQSLGRTCGKESRNKGCGVNRQDDP
jgi:GNAT superfamily N-acetyltransferase